jgi:SAM-dependent methyltransferase
VDSVAPFLEIPVRDDAREFSSIRRGFQTLDCLSAIGVRVAGQDVVDLGAGFGSLSIAAARSGAASVLAVDVHPERLAEIRLRAQGHKATVETLTLNLLDRWPGEPAADVAFLLGVVEYAGLWSEAGAPKDLQGNLLRTACEALRPGGLLVLGTKNRAWPGFLVKDVHTGQPLVNGLPRRLADRLSRRRFGTAYRHHLHTPRGWMKLLSEAGFRRAEAYVPYMSYQFPMVLTRRPALSDIAQMKRSAPIGPERDAALGRAPTTKALLMAAGGVLRLPISHSTVIVATK